MTVENEEHELKTPEQVIKIPHIIIKHGQHVKAFKPHFSTSINPHDFLTPPVIHYSQRCLQSFP